MALKHWSHHDSLRSCKFASPDGEKMRQTINDWIRTTKDLDGVADFHKIIRYPAHPSRFLPGYDSGDVLHPTPLD
jgi:hypothetical protein